MAGMKTLVGGEIEGYTDLLRQARQIATKRMVDEAEEMGADAVVNVRYASASIMQGAAEINTYGTAVRILDGCWCFPRWLCQWLDGFSCPMNWWCRSDWTGSPATFFPSQPAC